MRTTKKRVVIISLLFLLVLILLAFALLCKYYLFTNDTVTIHSYINQANGIRITIFENGALKINTEILRSEEKIYKDILNLFSTARVRPSPRQMIEKIFTGNTQMLGDANAQFSVFISLFQDEQVCHSIFLGGNNLIYFDKKEFFLGDFSNESEMQIMNEIYKLFQN